MPKLIPLGRIGSLDIHARPSALVGFALLWVFLSALGAFLLALAPLPALLGGGMAALLHYACELWHNLSHATAARRTGHPMTGIVFWGPLATSRYPANEGTLPGKVHVRRALGGPIGSAILSLLAGVLFMALSNASGSLSYWVALFFFADNLLVFTLGSLLPLGFTDGSTLLRWLGKP